MESHKAAGQWGGLWVGCFAFYLFIFSFFFFFIIIIFLFVVDFVIH